MGSLRRRDDNSRSKVQNVRKDSSEEFKGTGNMEIVLDRKLVDKRVFPAIDTQRSGTRKEELLIPKEDLQRIFVLRRVFNPLSPVEAMELLITYLEKSRNNAEFLTSMNQL